VISQILKLLKPLMATITVVVLLLTSMPLPATAQTYVDLDQIDRSVLPLQAPPQEPNLLGWAAALNPGAEPLKSLRSPIQTLEDRWVF
jgi:hypothetical protein